MCPCKIISPPTYMQTQSPAVPWAPPGSFPPPTTLNDRHLAPQTTTSAFPPSYLGPQQTHTQCAQGSNQQQVVQSICGVGSWPFPAPNTTIKWLVAFFLHSVCSIIIYLLSSILIHSSIASASWRSRWQPRQNSHSTEQQVPFVQEIRSCQTSLSNKYHHWVNDTNLESDPHPGSCPSCSTARVCSRRLQLSHSHPTPLWYCLLASSSSGAPQKYGTVPQSISWPNQLFYYMHFSQCNYAAPQAPLHSKAAPLLV